MTVVILLLVLAALAGFAFHLFFGRTLSSIPFYLIASVGGAVTGFALTKMLDINLVMVGGLPVATTLAGSLFFLFLVRRIQLT